MKIEKLKKWERVEIDWIDSMHRGKWIYEGELHDIIQDKYMKCKTIGFFFTQTKLGVVVVQSKSDDGEEKCNVDAVMQIPKVAITKIRRISK